MFPPQNAKLKDADHPTLVLCRKSKKRQFGFLIVNKGRNLAGMKLRFDVSLVMRAPTVKESEAMKKGPRPCQAQPLYFAFG
jgi:hypothetical protein